MTTLPRRTLIREGRIHDPVQGLDGEVRDLAIEDGRILALEAPADFRPDLTLQARGCRVMAGGVDIHAHIAGLAVNRARGLLRGETITPSDPGTPGGLVPSVRLTGQRYAAMGYTTAIDAAISPTGVRHAHREFEQTPCIDRAGLLVLSDHRQVHDALAAGDLPLARALTGELLREGGAYGIKVVNPGGARLWKKARGLVEGLDREIDHGGLTPRGLVRDLARIAHELRLPHPVHLHANRLGVPGNLETTLETLEALDGFPAHLAHAQFHLYDREPGKGSATFRSGVEKFLAALERHPRVTLDVGQVYFGGAITLTADRPVEHLLWQLTGSNWVNLDSELDQGCGVLPLEYRDRSEIHALQFAIGLELLLLSSDPWRLVLSTDHPNGASFVVYPRILACLMDRNFRESEVARVRAPGFSKTRLSAGIEREYSFNEVAIITRAAPARILGMASKGHLSPGADADITVYDDDVDRLRMFESPRYVLKGGQVVVAEGTFADPWIGGETLVAPLDPDPLAREALERHRLEHSTVHPSQHGLSEAELGGLTPVGAREEDS